MGGKDSFPFPSKYSDAKRAAEAVYSRRTEGSAILVRLPNVIGPGDHTNKLGVWVEASRKGEPISVGGENGRFSLIAPSSAARAIVEIAMRGANAGGAWNIASQGELSARKLANLFRGALGVDLRLVPSEAGAPGTPLSSAVDRFLDLSKARSAEITLDCLDEWIPDLVAETVKAHG